jgi:hypothetical protein
MESLIRHGEITITSLPPEALWTIFLAINDPRKVFTQLPRVCKKFYQTIKSRSVPILAHVDLISEDEEDASNAALIQVPEPAKLLTEFKPVKILTQLASMYPDLNREVAGPSWAPGNSTNTSPGRPRKVHTSTSASDSENPNSHTLWNKRVSDGNVIYVGAERHIRIHMGAIPEAAEALVGYVRELLKQNGVTARRSSAPETTKRIPVQVIFGTVQIKGRRGHTSSDVIGTFLNAMRPLVKQLISLRSEV